MVAVGQRNEVDARIGAVNTSVGDVPDVGVQTLAVLPIQIQTYTGITRELQLAAQLLPRKIRIREQRNVEAQAQKPAPRC